MHFQSSTFLLVTVKICFDQCGWNSHEKKIRYDGWCRYIREPAGQSVLHICNTEVRRKWDTHSLATSIHCCCWARCGKGATSQIGPDLQRGSHPWHLGARTTSLISVSVRLRSWLWTTGSDRETDTRRLSSSSLTQLHVIVPSISISISQVEWASL